MNHAKWKRVVKGLALFLSALLLTLPLGCSQKGDKNPTSSALVSSGESSDSQFSSSEVSSSQSSGEPESSEESSSSQTSSEESASSASPSQGGATSRPSGNGSTPAPSANPGGNNSKPPPASYLPAVTARMPSTGSTVYQGGNASIDASNTSSGYFMVKHSGSSSRIKVLVYLNGSSSYVQYNIASDGAYVTLPLPVGGSYRVRVMQNLEGSSYAEVMSAEFSVSLSSSSTPFLYPNQSVNYTNASRAVQLAREMRTSSTSVEELIDKVYSYITQNISYDYGKAQSATSTYLPNVDSTLATKNGICYDYAALMACMLRSQDVPTKLVIGQAGGGRHAWNEVLVNGAWKRYDATFGAAGQGGGTYVKQEER